MSPSGPSQRPHQRLMRALLLTDALILLVWIAWPAPDDLANHDFHGYVATVLWLLSMPLLVVGWGLLWLGRRFGGRCYLAALLLFLSGSVLDGYPPIDPGVEAVLAATSNCLPGAILMLRWVQRG